MSRFGLLAGTAAEGVDPTTQTWGLSTLGWFFVALPLLMFAAGWLVGGVRARSENRDAVADLVA